MYVSYAPTYSLVYGAFAAVPLFLIWIYLSWLVILLGAEITASAAYWHARLWSGAATPGMRLREAVLVTRRMLEAARCAARLRDAAHWTRALPAHELEVTLARLCRAGILRRVGRTGNTPSPPTRAWPRWPSSTRRPWRRWARWCPEEWAEVSEDFAHAADADARGPEAPPRVARDAFRRPCPRPTMEAAPFRVS